MDTLLNRDVADDLEMSESGVSRLRSGDRMPSFEVMRRIEAKYNWTMQDQSEARARGRWANEFEKALWVEAALRAANATEG